MLVSLQQYIFLHSVFHGSLLCYLMFKNTLHQTFQSYAQGVLTTSQRISGQWRYTAHMAC